MSGDVADHTPSKPAREPGASARARTGSDPFSAFRMSSTQIGAIGESDVANALMRASNGRFAPFRPMADDDGIDMLIFDKLTRSCLPLQIKTRTATDGRSRATVQFDVRRAACLRNLGAFVLCVLQNVDRVAACWLVPIADLEAIAKKTDEKLALTPSANHNSRDRYSSYRHTDLTAVAYELANRFDAVAAESL